MTLYEQLQTDWKAAFKAKEIIKKEILVFVIAQIKTKQIDEKKDLSDDEVMKIIKKEIKTRHESIAMLQTAAKADDIAIEQQKITILEAYLPEMLSEEQLKIIIQEKIQELSLEDLQKQRGQLIGAIMQQYGAVVDGSLLNQIITSLL